METLIYFYTSCLRISSYPTYEEWKHAKVDHKKPTRIPVLILPMRNGNKYLFGGDIIPLHFVLILPMRNGNEKINEVTMTEKEFLSYL